MSKKMEETDKEYIFRWGLPLKDLYTVALKFYKEKEGSAIQFSYEEKLRLIAYTKQVAHGKYNENVLSPLGVLDVIGRDRRLAWQALGDMSARDAMAGFINLIDNRCLHFNVFIQAQKAEYDEQNRKREERRKELAEAELQERAVLSSDTKRTQEETARRQIQDALNQQTFAQFKEYAEFQFPGNPEQQALLVRQLQDQHYHQYMLQLQQQQQNQHQINNNNMDEKTDAPKPNNAIILEGENDDTIYNANSVTRHLDEVHSDSEDSDCDTLIQPASMWTRKDIQEFKTQVKKEGTDTVIKIGHGETVTVRVPTHEGGSCLFWEFATDNYDIGFGVFFEWEKSATREVSVHISDTEDEDSDDLDEEQECKITDVERSECRSLQNKPPVSVIIPIFRRDCHEEVYAGSHSYPGEGVYLLKFDNSFSLWRSKTLYYRIYYTR